MVRILLFTLASLVPNVVLAQFFKLTEDMPVDVREYIENANTWRKRDIVRTEAKLEKVRLDMQLARRGVVDGKGTHVSTSTDDRGNRVRTYHFSSPASKRERIIKFKVEIESLESKLQDLTLGKPEPQPYIEVGDLNVGDVGRLRYPPSVATVQDHTVVAIKVFQIIDESNMLVKAFGELLWMSGVPTETLVDGKEVSFSTVFAITTTKKYDAVVGSNSVYVLEPVSMDQVRPHLQLVFAETEATKPGKPVPRDRESRAASLLRIAKLLLEKRPEVARERLQAIIEKYPDSNAAKEARTLIE